MRKNALLTGTSVGHITENVPRIAYNLVRCMAFDVTDEPDTTHITVRVNKIRLSTSQSIELEGARAIALTG